MANPEQETRILKDPGGNFDTRPTATARSNGPDLGRSPLFPVADWGRYRLIRFLGQGGMGRVFLAEDHHLKRHVAIKFLENPDPELSQRFLREARAQARVDHPCLCKVYEVDEVEGTPYIAMQYIQGKTLLAMYPEMSLAHKLLAMKKVSHAVHEAHRAGLVHRDLKPANIMLEETEDGDVKPVVLDFGIARFHMDNDLTMDGQILGTPHYMAPEQARGDMTQIDRRTDVYALGATLYHLLVGAPPFSSSSPAHTLVDILEKDAPTLRSRRSEIPLDVELIVLKCLEKEAHRRYDSARALADDLGCYLDGLPIAARPASVFYSWNKKLRRQKSLVAVIAAASLLLLMALGWGVRTSWQARVREELVRSFTEKVNHVEALARYAHLSPLHDIRDDRKAIRNEMVQIRQMMAQAGPLGTGPGNYALGMSHFSQGELEKAEDCLKAAWDVGYRDARVSYALGLVYADLFRKGCDQLSLIENANDRKRQRQFLETIWRDPAVRHMNAAKAAGMGEPYYLQALIAFHEGRYEQASQILTRTGKKKPWFYEHDKLAADVAGEMALAEFERGNEQEAEQLLSTALDFYSSASNTAESDPKIYQAVASILLRMTRFSIFTDGDPNVLFNKGLTQLSLAAKTDPDNGYFQLLESGFHERRAQWLRLKEEDPMQALGKAVKSAETALDKKVDASQGWLTLGLLYWREAQWRNDRREDPSQAIEQAVNALEKVEKGTRDYRWYFTSGLLQQSQGKWLKRNHQPSEEHFRHSSRAFRRAISIEPNNPSAYNALGNVLYGLSSLETVSPHASLQLLEETIQTLTRGLAINPNQPALHYLMGRAYNRMARGGKSLGWQYDLDLADKALIHYEKALDLNPKLGQLYFVIGRNHQLRAAQAWDIGEDPHPHIQAALNILNQGLAVAPGIRNLQVNLAWTFYFQGKYLIRQGEDPGDAFTRAIELANHLTQVSEIEAHLILGSTLRLQAEQGFHLKRDIQPAASQARAFFEKILENDPNSAEALRSMVCLFTLMARHEIARGGNPENLFNMARYYLNQALCLQGNNPVFLLTGARLALHEGCWLVERGDEADKVSEWGMTFTSRALLERPDLLEAQFLHASFWHLKGGPNSEPSQILAANPNLFYEWSGTNGVGCLD